ncbi:MAG TPA: mechanosensitive ion channel domain-containing protein [Polyangiaceae bacterium]|jgi:small-conductance mechanosensitive channel|nr:mechanosensitive ion channel domain-containing protein [Polyangiaceae bacterium]
MPNLKEFLDLKLFSLAGAAITPASLLAGAAVVVVALAIANLLGLSARRLLHARGTPHGVQFAVAKIVRYAVLAIGFVGAFNAMGFQLDALLAASAVVAVGIGFGLQNIAQNFISGLILLFEQPVRHGDFVRVGETLGTVEDIGLRATHIITRDEVTIIVPNSALVTGEVVNHSRPTTSLRIRVTVGVAYGTDPELVKRVLLDVAKKSDAVLDAPKAEVRLEDFADSSLVFSLLAWIANARDDLRVGSALRFAIEKAFREASIAIPFPQREVTLKKA